MLTYLSLFTCALATAQPTGGGEWLLQPRLTRGQELVYRGSYTEESLQRGVQFSRVYRLESRVFVTHVGPKGTDLALMTTYKARPLPGETGIIKDAVSVRLDLGQMDSQGKVTGKNIGPLPLDELPPIETGALMELPRRRVKVEQSWEAIEAGRPPRSWRVAGTESLGGSLCLKLVGVQESEDWDHPRADQQAWRRQDTVWINSRLGVAHKVERIIEHREAARREATHKSVMRYEMESSLSYPGQLFEERRQEIQQARALEEAALPYFKEPGKFLPQLEALQTKISYFLDNRPATPYREAVLQVRRQVDLARRGGLPPIKEKTPSRQPAVAVLDRPAPDFVATDLTTQKSARLRRFLGKPVLMVFYNPASRTIEDVMTFAKKVQAQDEAMTILCLAMTDDADKVLQQRDELKLPFPILSGQGLRQTYQVEATPKFVVVDGEGVIRGSYIGWGRETPGAVTEELKRWKKKQESGARNQESGVSGQESEEEEKETPPLNPAKP